MSLINVIRTNFERVSDIEAFIRFCNARISKGSNSDCFALFEIQVNIPAYIGYYNFAQIFDELKITRIAYRPINDMTIFKRIKFRFFQMISADNGIYRPFRIYKSFGIKKFIIPRRLLSFELHRILKLYRQFILMTKEERQFFECSHVRVGDLFYDWHLRNRELATIPSNSFKLFFDFVIFFNSFFYWRKFFLKRAVDSVLVSHGVYAQGMVARLGIHFGVKVFLVGADSIYRLSEKEHFPYNEFKTYNPRKLNQLGYTVNFDRAKIAIENLFLGDQTVDYAHSYVSGFKGSHNEIVIERNPSSVNVLIAAHCFSDAPHALGGMLFTDFYEWLNHIGIISQHLNFNWYVKEHPGFFESDFLHFNHIMQKFPHIKSISSGFSNQELFRQGINAVLTVHGTIAFEAAYQNILVINASTVAPHVNYEFSLCPKNIFELDHFIKDLPNLVNTFKINRQEVLHFYDLHHLRTKSNIYFGEQYEALLSNIGGYPKLFTSPSVLGFWIQQFSASQQKEYLLKYKSFYQSEDYFLI